MTYTLVLSVVCILNVQNIKSEVSQISVTRHFGYVNNQWYGDVLSVNEDDCLSINSTTYGLVQAGKICYCSFEKPTFHWNDLGFGCYTSNEIDADCDLSYKDQPNQAIKVINDVNVNGEIGNWNPDYPTEADFYAWNTDKWDKLGTAQYDIKQQVLTIHVSGFNYIQGKLIKVSLEVQNEEKHCLLLKGYGNIDYKPLPLPSSTKIFTITQVSVTETNNITIKTDVGKTKNDGNYNTGVIVGVVIAVIIVLFIIAGGFISRKTLKTTKLWKEITRIWESSNCVLKTNNNTQSSNKIEVNKTGQVASSEYAVLDQKQIDNRNYASLDQTNLATNYPHENNIYADTNAISSSYNSHDHIYVDDGQERSRNYYAKPFAPSAPEYMETEPDYLQPVTEFCK